jgi:hypothetical protein
MDVCAYSHIVLVLFLCRTLTNTLTNMNNTTHVNAMYSAQTKVHIKSQVSAILIVS